MIFYLIDIFEDDMVKNISYVVLLFFTSCGVFKSNTAEPKREFRGFWVATVANIDWPKNGNDSLDKQKDDYLKLLEFYQNLHFNTAIVQIRTAGDAFYPSDYAPWSRFLTGVEGEAPNSSDDILTWMISETHKRGMEFHAWLNPYRATMNENTEILSPLHDYNRHPEWMLKYGSKFYYNPGIPKVQEHLNTIMAEVVAKYDVDAIHFDDYFYPYKIKDEVLTDSLSFKNYALPNQSIEDWRRSNVDSLVKNVHLTIKSIKPWVQFGISPFGVWKNKATDPEGSDTRAGQTTYDDLYADPLLWMEKGWIDYLLPQVYWSMALPEASHRKIVVWWANKSKPGTNLYIGNGPYKIRNNNDAAWNNKKELPNQIGLARKTPKVSGNAFFSAKSLMQNNSDVTDYLKKNYYKKPALPPLSYKPIIAVSAVQPESVLPEKDSIHLKFDNLEPYRYALFYTSGKNAKRDYPMRKLLKKTLITNSKSIQLISKDVAKEKYVALTFIDKFGQETNPVVLYLGKP